MTFRQWADVTVCAPCQGRGWRVVGSREPIQDCPECDGAGRARPAYDPCDYHAGHRCRKCSAHVTDMEYIASGLFLGLCSLCLASARQTLKDISA